MRSLRGLLDLLPQALVGAPAIWREPEPAAIRSELGQLSSLEGDTPAGRLSRLAPILEAWQDAASPERRAAEHFLPAMTGFSREMIRFGLPFQCRRIAPSTLETAIRLGHPRLAHRGRTAVVLAGNIPAMSLLEALLSIVAGSETALKLPTGEPLTGLLLAAQIRRVLAATRSALTAFWWPGGDAAREAALFDWADQFFAYGTDEAVTDLRRRYRQTRDTRAGTYWGFGHRLSAGYLPLDGFMLEEACRRFAVDVAMWDQEGCLSPHVIFIARRGEMLVACEALAGALAQLDARLPLGETTFHRKIGIQTLRSDVQARMLADPAVRMWPPGGVGNWRVILDPARPLHPSPLGRTVFVRPVSGDREMCDALAAWAGRLQCLGVAGEPAAFAHLTGPLAKFGATRLCAAGRMQEPGAEWFGEEPGPGGRRVCAVDAATEGAWQTLFERE